MTTALPIGTRIKRARERKRWTQRQLADALGVNAKTIDNWENGRTAPRSSIGALEQVLGVSLDSGPAREPGPLDDLLPWQDDWEAETAANPDLPADIRRRFITDWRAARAAARHRQQPGDAAAETA